jgi:cytochrome c peroxidase
MMRRSNLTPRTYVIGVVIALGVFAGSVLLLSFRNLYDIKLLFYQPGWASRLMLIGGGVAPEFASVLVSSFAPLPVRAESAEHPATVELIDLGRMLFFDARLSMSQTISCNTCHPLDQYGVDGRARSIGHKGATGKRNAPTVYNAALHLTQFWDGRSRHVEDQVRGPLLGPAEMGMLSPGNLLFRLQSIPGYQALFAAAFPNEPEPISLPNVGIAIGAFERGLITPARFDRFLAGDVQQLNEQELRGLVTFVSLGCQSCHYGPTLGGQSYTRLKEAEIANPDDVGRFRVTQAEGDTYVFKAPGLRNILHTAPYGYDGSVATINEMVRRMIRHRAKRSATDEQVADLIAFFDTLTGALPFDYIQMPELPPSPTQPLQSFPKDSELAACFSCH